MGLENLASTGIRSPDRPPHSESLYWLCCPSPRTLVWGLKLENSTKPLKLWNVYVFAKTVHIWWSLLMPTHVYCKLLVSTIKGQLMVTLQAGQKPTRQNNVVTDKKDIHWFVGVWLWCKENYLWHVGVKIFIVLKILKIEVGKLRLKFCIHH